MASFGHTETEVSRVVGIQPIVSYSKAEITKLKVGRHVNLIHSCSITERRSAERLQMDPLPSDIKCAACHGSPIVNSTPRVSGA